MGGRASPLFSLQTGDARLIRKPGASFKPPFLHVLNNEINYKASSAKAAPNPRRGRVKEKSPLQRNGSKKGRNHNLAFGIENVHGAFKELPYGHFDVPCGMNISVRTRTYFSDKGMQKATAVSTRDPARVSSRTIQFSPNVDPGMTDGFQMP